MFLRSILSKAAPAGYTAISIPELFEEMEKTISKLKYTIATSTQDDQFNETLHNLQASIKNILALLDKKFHALIGEENSETAKRNKLIKNIERKIKIILTANTAATSSEKIKERLKKLPNEITNHCHILLISVQNDINKIVFFPTMAKNELIALIAEAAAELPIFLLKKYIECPAFKDAKEDQAINSEHFLKSLSLEDKIKIYNYYCENASLPVEQQSVVYKLISRGMNEAAYERKLISDENYHELTKRMPPEMWGYTTQFLGDRDLAAFARACTLFRGVASSERAQRDKIKRDYGNLLSTITTEATWFPDETRQFITLKGGIIAAATFFCFSVITLESATGDSQELLRIDMPENDFNPLGFPQLLLCNLTKSTKGQLIATFEEDISYHKPRPTIVRIWGLQATNKLKNSFTLPPYLVEKSALTDDAETLIFNHGLQLFFWDVKSNRQLKSCADFANKFDILITSTQKIITMRTYNGLNPNLHFQIDVWDKKANYLFSIFPESKDIEKIGLISDNLLAAYTRNKIYIWNLDCPQLTNEIDYNPEHINKKMYNPIPLPNGKIAFAYVNNNRCLHLDILDIDSKQLIYNQATPNIRKIRHLTITEEGNIVVLVDKLDSPTFSLTTIIFRFAELQPDQENTHDGEKVEKAAEPTLKLSI